MLYHLLLAHVGQWVLRGDVRETEGRVVCIEHQVLRHGLELGNVLLYCVMLGRVGQSVRVKEPDGELF